MRPQYIETMSWTSLLRSQCEVCRQWSSGRLCADCIERFAAPVPRCGRCARRWPGGPAPCGDCLRSPPPVQSCVCVADYAFPWDRLIASFKFRGLVELAGPLAAPLAARVAWLPVQASMVLPVPLSPRRLADRGYNQAWELARRVARRLGLPARCDLLRRTRETAHQADLPRPQRLQNLRDAFQVAPQAAALLSGRHVALVDDVMTTGATVREAALALQRAGAAAVSVWVLARTPEV